MALSKPEMWFSGFYRERHEESTHGWHPFESGL
jgi:hypothetical protein